MLTGLTIFSLIAATKVITAVNPVHSIFLLVVVFLSTSVRMINISMEFRALVFIMVYVGAIAVLFLFVIMMLNVKSESHLRPLGNVPRRLVVAVIFVLFRFSSVLSNIVLDFSDVFILNNDIVSIMDRKDNIVTVGQVLYTKFSIQFLIAGVVLLVSIIGAVLLTLTYQNNDSNAKLTPALRQQVHQQHSRDSSRAIFQTYLNDILCPIEALLINFDEVR